MRTALPDRPQAEYVLGLIARSADRTDDAIEAFTRVRKLDPTDVGAAINLGQLLVQTRRFDEAIKLLRPAVEAEPLQRDRGVWSRHGAGPQRRDRRGPRRDGQVPEAPGERLRGHLLAGLPGTGALCRGDRIDRGGAGTGERISSRSPLLGDVSAARLVGPRAPRVRSPTSTATAISISSRPVRTACACRGTRAADSLLSPSTGSQDRPPRSSPATATTTATSISWSCGRRACRC